MTLPDVERTPQMEDAYAFPRLLHDTLDICLRTSHEAKVDGGG